VNVKEKLSFHWVSVFIRNNLHMLQKKTTKFTLKSYLFFSVCYILLVVDTADNPWFSRSLSFWLFFYSESHRSDIMCANEGEKDSTKFFFIKINFFSYVRWLICIFAAKHENLIFIYCTLDIYQTENTECKNSSLYLVKINNYELKYHDLWTVDLN